MRSHKKLMTAVAALTISAFVGGNATAAKYGTPISEADIAAWNIDISTSTGEGLPDLQRQIVNRIGLGGFDPSRAMAFTRRQVNLLLDAAESLEKSRMGRAESTLRELLEG